MVLEKEKDDTGSDLISIIIPVFNREDFITDTLLSVQNQDYPSWQAIIVDDGSTDRSIKIIEDFLKKDTRFQFFNRSRVPKGAQTCRNIGMENAKGKYLIFLDSDDLLAPYCLSKRILYMKKNPELDFSVHHVILFEKEPGDNNILWNILDDSDDLLRFYNNDVPWQTSSPIWKKEFVDRLRWDESCISGQDWDFHVKALSLEPKYKKNNDVPDCFIRRDHTVERISRNFYKGPQILNREMIWKKNCRILKERNLWKKEYNLPFASFYFRFCEFFLLKLKNPDFNVWNFYKNVYHENLVKTNVFIWTSFYLMGLDWLRNHKFMKYYFQKRLASLMPKDLTSKNLITTQERIKLEGSKLEQFLKANEGLNFRMSERSKS